MVEAHVIIGLAVIVLNLIPFLLKKSRYVYVTIIISFIMLFLLASLS